MGSRTQSSYGLLCTGINFEASLSQLVISSELTILCPSDNTVAFAAVSFLLVTLPDVLHTLIFRSNPCKACLWREADFL